MNNWRGNLIVVLFGGMIMFLLIAPFYVYQDHSDCESKGGIPTRAGCLKPEVFIK